MGRKYVAVGGVSTLERMLTQRRTEECAKRAERTTSTMCVYRTLVQQINSTHLDPPDPSLPIASGPKSTMNLKESEKSCLYNVKSLNIIQFSCPYAAIRY